MKIKGDYENGKYVEYLAVSFSELKTIEQPLKQALRRAEKRLEKFRDIHESGEATELQQTKMFKWEEIVNVLGGLIGEIGKA